MLKCSSLTYYITAAQLRKKNISNLGVFTILTIFALLFIASLLAVSFAGKLSMLVVWLYLISSVITFIVYAHDKSAAQKKQWRIPENTLHILATIGGWPGALLAQNWLRHKSQKTSFRAVFWMTVLVNCGLLGWWLSAN